MEQLQHLLHYSRVGTKQDYSFEVPSFFNLNVYNRIRIAGGAASIASLSFAIF
ncbi:hypothetical protein RintRC_1318 [Richelia intracellularis]|nr:hypothetical protein RintRC_1318 [Richelia intracellularis]